MIKRGLSSRGILRGTSLATLLGGFGHRLRTTSGRFGSVVDATENDYARSFQVQNLDFFLSHSWQANWWLKYTALLFYFNSIPASVAGMCAGVACFMWLWTGERTQSELEVHGKFRSIPPYCFCAGGIAYFAVLFNWHHLTALLPARWGGRSWQPTVFLDKVCINQANPQKKELGIRSIGGILARSSNFLVAWDATYFSRLWCTYEISAFMRDQHGGSVILLPISFGALVVIILCGEIAADSLNYAVLRWIHTGITWEIVEDLYVAAWFFISLCCFMILRKCAEDLVTLDAQLSEFSIEKSKCFCCTNDHVNPTTGDSLPCDRQLVYDDIETYEGGDGQGHADEKAGLKAFNNMVRTTFREGVKRNFGGSSHLKYFMVLNAGIFDGLDTLDINLGARPSAVWIVVYRVVFYTFFFLPNNIGLLMVAARHTWHLPKLAWQRRLWDLAIALAFAGISKLMQFIDVRVSTRGDWLGAAWLLLNAALVYPLYFRSVCCCSGGSCGNSHSHTADPDPLDARTPSTHTSDSGTSSDRSSSSSDGSFNV